MAMPDVTLRGLLEAGVHFGHHTRRWNPKMAPYIFGVRNQVHILDLQQTVPMLDRALRTVRDVVAGGGRVLDLTFKEFELLKYLAQHPGRVFTRDQLLQEVWGYDYFGGTRTVDVHVRRLRAKLGPDNETLIGTVRNVGYRFVIPTKESSAAVDRTSSTVS